MLHKVVFAVAFLFPALNTKANKGYEHVQNYILQYAEIAVNEMHRTKIPASITLAQGMVESGYGQSVLAIRANNHFGIKCKSNWDGECYPLYDDEFDENMNLKLSYFRAYENVIESFFDHSDFLLNTPRYSELFKLGYNYKLWAKGLQQYGYATRLDYAQILIETIEKYQLYKYDDVIEEDHKFVTLKELLIQNQAIVHFNNTIIREDVTSTKENKNAEDNQSPPAPFTLPANYRRNTQTTTE
ncbi:MAG: glucosaminidase domain-containing protein [Saprospiraceae bacterium]